MITSLSTKNMALTSPAVNDLGLGDQLRNEVENQLIQRRKQQQMQTGVMSANGAGLFGSAVSDLLSVSKSGLGV